MAQVMTLDAALRSSMPSQGKPQTAAGLGFALSLENALSSEAIGAALEALFAMPAGKTASQGLTAAQAVALENLAASCMPASTSGLAKAGKESETATEGEKPEGGSLDALLAALMPLLQPVTFEQTAQTGTAGEQAGQAAAVAEQAPQPANGAQQGGQSGQAQADAQAFVQTMDDAIGRMVDAVQGSDEAHATATVDGVGGEKTAQPQGEVKPAVAQTIAPAAQKADGVQVDAAGGLVDGGSAKVGEQQAAQTVGTQEAPGQAAAQPAAQQQQTVASPQAGNATVEAAASAVATQTIAGEPVEKEAAGTADAVETDGLEAIGTAKADATHKAAARETERAQSSDQERIIARIADAVAQADRNGRSTVRIRLYPPELGAVRVEVTSVRGHLTARIETSTVEAQNAINSNLSALRAQLRESGVDMRDVSVQYRNASMSFGATHDDARRGGYSAPRQHGRGRFEADETAEPAQREAALQTAGTIDVLL